MMRDSNNSSLPNIRNTSRLTLASFTWEKIQSLQTLSNYYNMKFPNTWTPKCKLNIKTPQRPQSIILTYKTIYSYTKLQSEVHVFWYCWRSWSINPISIFLLAMCIYLFRHNSWIPWNDEKLLFFLRTRQPLQGLVKLKI